MINFKNYFDDVKRRNIVIEEGKIDEWQNYINRIPMLKVGVDVLKQIEKIGKDNGLEDARAYIVGGTVRDIIIGQDEPDDIDIATNVPIDILDEHFSSHDIGKNKDFGILVINEQGHEFEIANFRKDGEYSDGRRPDTVEIVGDFKEDAARRDFTINAMAVDDEGNIIDYFDGQKDIKNKVIRTVGEAHKRFDEDYIRMMRAVRFGSRLGFDIEADTLQAIKDNAGKLEGQAKERIMKEVYKMAKQDGSKFADALVTLKETGLLSQFLPELVEMDEFKHEIEHHPEGDGNVLEHVLAVVRNTGSKDAIINLAALLHDIGKVDTHGMSDQGKHTYIGHAKRGGEMIDEIAERLKMSTKDKKSLQFAAVNHMKMHSILDMSDSKILKLIDDGDWEVLYNTALADAKAREHLFDKDEWEKVDNKIDSVKSKFANAKIKSDIKKMVNGKYIMELLDIKGGKLLGDIINDTVSWIIDNSVDLSDRKKIDEYIKSSYLKYK